MNFQLLKVFILFNVFCIFQVYGYDESQNLDSTETQTSKNYTCKIDSKCLIELDDSLDKKSNTGIYQYCKITYQNIKLCCENPLQCQESYGKDVAQDLKRNSLNLAQKEGSISSCQLNNLSHLLNSLSNVQSEMCHVGIKNCKIDCDNKLKELKDTFKQCFSIPDHLSIDEVLKKSQSPLKNQDCYKKMKEFAKKYKDQSLNKKFLFREDIESKDIVKCDDIKKEKTKSNLNNLVLNVCEKAKEEQEQITGNQQEQLTGNQNQQESQRNDPYSFKDQPILKSERQLEEERWLQEKKEAQRKEEENPKVLSEFNKLNDKQKRDFLANKYRHLRPYEQEAIRNSEEITKWSRADRKKREEEKAEAKRIEEESKLSYKAKKLGAKVLGGLSAVGSFFVGDVKAQKECNPQITNQMVYQSVEAPQIDSLDKQEFQQDPNNPIFKSFDLARAKTAGILVKMNYPTTCPTLKEKFHLKMLFDSLNEIIPNCLSVNGTKKDNLRLINQTNPPTNPCFFSTNDFINGIAFKYVTLPMWNINAMGDTNKNKYNIPVKVNIFKGNDLISNTIKDQISNKKKQLLSRCDEIINLHSPSEFCVNVISTDTLSLGVLTIKGSCKNRDLSTNSYAMTKFINSSEVKNYLPTIFPMPEPSTINEIVEPLKLEHIRKSERIIKRKTLFNLNKNKSPGDNFLSSPPCNNTHYFTSSKFKGDEWSHGLLEMLKSIRSLLVRAKKSGKNRIVTILSRDFMNYHNISPATMGFVWGYKDIKIYRKILFVADDELDNGTLLHELAHTMGQRKEFYDTHYDNDINRPVLCQRFNGSPQVSCKFVYRIKSGLKGKLSGPLEWISKTHNNDIHSIMSNEKKLNVNWIDRETYQKTFDFLASSYDRLQRRKKRDQERKIEKSPKVVFSGSYNSQTKKMESTETEIVDEEFEITPPILKEDVIKNEKLDYIKIRLIKNNELVHEVKHPSSMYLKVHYRNGEIKTIPWKDALIQAVLPLKDKGQYRVQFFRGHLKSFQGGVEPSEELRPFQETNFTY